MCDFPFIATVIVPIYNSEKFLDKCISSLINQSADFSKIEVLLINDGSTDSSESICRKYSDKYENIKLISKENEGLSITRNRGLSLAKGKYIFFLDSDDTLREDTIDSVVNFFETVYDKVDLVTYRITQYYNGKPKLVHYRYKTLVKSGIYDLSDPKNAFITQTNINICVKNRGENNILFDSTENFKHEDEKYCCDILKEKMKIGFCSNGEYIYNRNNEQSIVASAFLPDIIFESSMEFYEKLFSDFNYKVPQYFQGIVFNDLRWKLKENKLLPTKGGEQYLRHSQERIDNLLMRIDADIIINHPTVNKEHIFYWLNHKPNCSPAVFTFSDKVCIVADGKILYSTKSFTAKTDSDIAVVKSPIFFFLRNSQYKIELICGEKVTVVSACSADVNSIPAYAEFHLPDNVDEFSESYLTINSQIYKLILK